MIYLLYTLHITICIFLILVVLLQQGKGADLSVFGGGTTMAAFGARSATNLLHRLTVEGSSFMKAVAPVSAPATTPAAPVVPAAAPATTPPEATPPPAETPAPAPQAPNQ